MKTITNCTLCGSKVYHNSSEEGTNSYTRYFDYRPMDTSPLDGTPIDLWCSSTIKIEGSSGFRLTDCFYSKEHKQWMRFYGPEILPIDDCEMLYWMPVLKGPKIKTDD